MSDDQSFRGIAQTFSGLNALAGLWLILAPWLLGYDEVPTAFWNDVLVGSAVMVLAGIRVFTPATLVGLSWTNMVLGAWLMIAPVVLEYGNGSVVANVAFWNDVVAGFVVIALAWLSADTTRRMYFP